MAGTFPFASATPESFPVLYSWFTYIRPSIVTSWRSAVSSGKGVRESVFIFRVAAIEASEVFLDEDIERTR